MIPFDIAFTAAMVLVGAGLAGWLSLAPTSWVRVRRAGFVNNAVAYLDPSFVAAFDARTRRDSRRFAALVLALCTGLVLTVRMELAPMLIGAPLFATFVGVESLARLREAGREFPVPDHPSAVARPRRVGLSDYVPPVAQLQTWALVAVAAAAAANALLRPDVLDLPRRLAVAFAAVVILSVAGLSAWFGHQLCERPTPAVDASHLYLQDAWRADALTKNYDILRTSAFFLTLGISTAWTGFGGGYAISLALAVCALVIQLCSAVSGFATHSPTGPHFRRRLWSTLSPGAVLLPGQPVPSRTGVPA